MTLQGIAKLTGRSKSTIFRWYDSCSKMEQETRSKMEQANKTQKAHDFTLEETIEIMKAGKVSDFIITALINETKRVNDQGQPKTNAVSKLTANEEVKELKLMVQNLILSIPEIIKTTIMAMQNTQKQVTADSIKKLEPIKDKAYYQGQWIADKIRKADERKKIAKEDEMDLFQ